MTGWGEGREKKLNYFRVIDLIVNIEEMETKILWVDDRVAIYHATFSSINKRCIYSMKRRLTCTINGL